MLLWKTIDVEAHQRAFLYEKGQFKTVLVPGRHRVMTFKNAIRVEMFDITEVIFKHPKLKFLLSTYGEQLQEVLDNFDLGDKEVGLLYRDNHLVDVMAPGSQLTVWKGVEKVHVERVNITEDYVIPENLLSLVGRGVSVGQSRELVKAVSYVEVPDEHVGLLSVNGKLERLLKSGSYGFWKYNRSVSVKLLDLRLQAIEVSGQEILTKDRVSLRINLTGSYKLVEPKTVALKLGDYAGFIYRELQLRLREAVGTKTLDELLENKDALNSVIADDIRSKLDDYGIELISIGVKDIILPGDMKVILNKVVEAQKESEANVVRRREETQAMRSMHNTAKMMENNPVLLRMKEMEALERVTERIDKITVYGGLDGVMNDLVKLAPASGS